MSADPLKKIANASSAVASLKSLSLPEMRTSTITNPCFVGLVCSQRSAQTGKVHLVSSAKACGLFHVALVATPIADSEGLVSRQL